MNRASIVNQALGDVNGAPEWILLIPAGTFSGRDGRGPFKNNDPEAIIRNTRGLRMEAGLPIDFDHATDFAAPKGAPAPAAAWIKELQVRDGAIWGKLEWTDRGRAAVAAKEWRYISPVFEFDRDGKIFRLLRAGLTNSPNLHATAICAAEEQIEMEEPTLDENERKIIGHFASITPAEFAQERFKRSAREFLGASAGAGGAVMARRSEAPTGVPGLLKFQGSDGEDSKSRAKCPFPPRAGIGWNYPLPPYPPKKGGYSWNEGEILKFRG